MILRASHPRPHRLIGLLLAFVMPLIGLRMTEGFAKADVPGPPAGMVTVFSDDFNGPAGSALDTSNWLYDTGTSYPGGAANWGTGEVETYTNSTNNVSLDGNGHLVITPIQDASGNWTSGRVETQRTDWTAPAGGEMEISASIKQPNPANGLGIWPAFWALGAPARPVAATNWPSIGELDVMEDVNGLSRHSATFHCGVAPGGLCNENTGISSGLQACSGCQTGYHTYSVIVDRTNTSDEQLRFYLDGAQTYSVNESQVDATTWQNAIDHGFFAIFNVAVGGSYPNRICGCTTPASATTSGAGMSVDWFAVYQTPVSSRQTMQFAPYDYGVNDAPAPGFDLFHVKIRKGHKHTLEFKSFGPGGAIVDDHTVKVKEGYNAWYDPSRVSKVQITISSGHPAISDSVDGYHCYYEDGHGDLQAATDRPCNAK